MPSLVTLIPEDWDFAEVVDAVLEDGRIVFTLRPKPLTAWTWPL